MAKRGFFRRITEATAATVKKVTDPIKRVVAAPFKSKAKPKPKKSVPAPRPAPPIGQPLSPGRRAQTYIDDLKDRGKEAVYPSDFTSEDWRAFDERGGTPSLGGGK